MLDRKSANHKVRVRAGGEARSDRAVAKRRLGVGLALILVAGLVVGVGAPSAAQTESGPSVRIWARKLASADLQFGMSVRLAGTTSNVSLTNSYFRYESNQVDTWYNSEWIVVGSSRAGVTGPGSVNTVARVRARKLTSGSVEFGLEFRGLGAVGMNNRQAWAPRARYFLYQTARENVSAYSSAFDVSSQAHECLNGTVFSDPQDNLGLADDCATLLASKDILSTSTELLESWNTNTPMFGGNAVDGWWGVHKQGDYDRVETLAFGWQDDLPSGHALDGSLPSYLGALAGLKYLDLDHPSNDLSGSIPAELGSLSNLVQIKLSGNSLTGSIPTELEGESLPNLEFLLLDKNWLSGDIPVELGSLPRLKRLWLNSNSLTGNIPAELGNLTNLEYLYLDRNRLEGNIPTELGSLSNLEYLYLGDNSLTGNIPTELGSLTDLKHLSLEHNSLSGSIPSELGSLTNLTRLHLDRNDLDGSIPPELGDLSSIQELYIGLNSLSGSIPSELGNLSATLQSIKFYDSMRRPTDDPASDDNSGLSGCVPKSLEGGTITVFRGNLPFCAS